MHPDGTHATRHPLGNLLVRESFQVAQAALDALLPDRWLADHPEHRLEQREEESREAKARRRRKRAARRFAAAQ
ncbi:MAG: hypothetical protein ACLP9L_09970 [Thermoguttaceae bacterium]